MAVDREFRVKVNIEANPAGAKQTAEALDEVGAAGKKSAGGLDESTAAAKKAFVSKAQLKGAVKGLREEFPMLAHVAKMALNPIAFIVAGIGGAFAVWKYRVDELSRALSGVELPDVSEAKIGHINAMTQAWNGFAAALNKTVEAYNSVDAAADRAAKGLTAEEERKKKLLAANKALELSELEKKKASMGAGEYETKRLAIEDKYAKAGIAVDEEAKIRQLAAKDKQRRDLITDAHRKTIEASGIHVASPEDDVATEAKMKLQADAAQKSIDERKKRIGDLQDYKAGEGGKLNRVWTGIKLAGTSPDDQLDLEKIGTAADQTAVNRYHEFLKRKPYREEARKRRDELMADSAKETGEAYTMGHDIPNEVEEFKRDRATNRQVEGMESRARGNEAYGKMSTEQYQLQAEVNRASQAGNGVLVANLAAIKALGDKMEELQKQLTQAQLRANSNRGAVNLGM